MGEVEAGGNLMRGWSYRSHSGLLIASLSGCSRNAHETALLAEALELRRRKQYRTATRVCFRAFESLLLRERGPS